MKRQFTTNYSDSYNTQHKRSALRFTTPQQRHTGEPEIIFEHRTEVYEAAKAQRPDRWYGDIRDWNLSEQVWLNPESALQEFDQAAYLQRQLL